MAPAPVTSPPPEPSSSTTDGIPRPPPDIVNPPKDLRAIIEKTAGYVFRNGAAFEERLRVKEASNPKFGFLNEYDAYHRFFAWRLDEIRAGRTTDISEGRTKDTQVKSDPDEKPKGPEAPPEFHFSARMPNINAQDLEVLQLTAYYVARNGRTFMNTIAQRKAGDFQFDFLRPQHSLHQYFSRLVDQYSELVNMRQVGDGKMMRERISELKADAGDRFRVLTRAKKRAEWVKFQEQEKQKEEKEAEAEKVAYAQIDWHDFEVVQTIVFDGRDNEAELPPPTSLSDLQTASLEQRAAVSLAPNHRRIEEAMPTDNMSQYYEQPAAQPYMPQPSQSPAGLPLRPPSQPPIPSASPMPPPPTYSPVPPVPPAVGSPFPPPTGSPFSPPPGSPAPPPGIDSAPGATQPQGAAPMKIRSNYVPRAQQARAQKSVATSLCPHCGKQILNSEYAEHVRIELLSKNWQKERAKAESRSATTNLNPADVANNLKRLASQRTDLFDGVTGEPLTEEESARRKRAALQYDGVIQGTEGYGRAAAGREAMANAAAREKVANAMQGVSAPGAPAPNPGQGMSVEEQLKSIKARHGQQ